MFEAGAGQIGRYDCCSFEVQGEGQFRPGPGSQPFLGVTNQLEKIEEFKVEMVCADEHIQAALKALKSNHPYETPAYAVWRLAEF